MSVASHSPLSHRVTGLLWYDFHAPTACRKQAVQRTGTTVRGNHPETRASAHFLLAVCLFMARRSTRPLDMQEHRPTSQLMALFGIAPAVMRPTVVGDATCVRRPRLPRV